MLVDETLMLRFEWDYMVYSLRMALLSERCHRRIMFCFCYGDARGVMLDETLVVRFALHGVFGLSLALVSLTYVEA